MLKAISGIEESRAGTMLAVLPAMSKLVESV